MPNKLVSLSIIENIPGGRIGGGIACVGGVGGSITGGAPRRFVGGGGKFGINGGAIIPGGATLGIGRRPGVPPGGLGGNGGMAIGSETGGQSGMSSSVI